MADVYTGQVKKVFTKDGRWSLLMDDDNWYGLNRVRPPKGVVEGATIKFEFDQNGRYLNADPKSIKVKGGAPASSSGGTKGRAGASDYAKKEQYWADKEQRDINTQHIISFQAAMNTAKGMVDTALEHGFLTAPKGKVADRMDAYNAMVYEQALVLYRTFQGIPDTYEDMLAVEEEAVDLPEDMGEVEESNDESDEDWD